MEYYKIKVFWGTEKARWAEDQDPEILDKSEEGELRTFDTEGELRAYIQGVEDSNGWDEYLIHEML